VANKKFSSPISQPNIRMAEQVFYFLNTFLVGLASFLTPKFLFIFS